MVESGQMQNKQLLVVGLIALALAFIILFMLAIADASIPPEDMTRSTQMFLEVRIREYFEKKRVLPRSLRELPRIERKDNSTKDGWGREMQYLTNGNVVLLRSYGRDGKIGGKGKDVDAELTFTLP